MQVGIVILAAGQGTRMNSDVPKVLHTVAGRSMAAEVLTVAQALAPEELVMVIGYGADRVRAELGERVTYVTQAEQLGTGHAVAQAEPALRGRTDDALVLYGDTPLIRQQTLKRLLRLHRETEATVTLLSFEPEDPAGYGRILRDGNDHIVGIVEHKDATPAQRAVRECNSGIMAFEAEWLWSHLDRLTLSPQGEYYLTDLVAMAVEEHRRVSGFVATDPTEVMGVNTRSHLADATRVLYDRRRHALLQNGITLVDPATVYVGPDVVVERDTIIEPNVHLSGHTTIGPACRIGANSRLHNVTLSANCIVRNLSHLEDVTLEEGTSLNPLTTLTDETQQIRPVE